MPASDGNSDTYLVPGYRLTSDDGHLVDIPALPDDLLADGSADESAPTVTQPHTTDTGMATPPCVEATAAASGPPPTSPPDRPDITTIPAAPDPAPPPPA